MSLHTCALCGEYTDLPDLHWIRARWVQAPGKTAEWCSPRCAVLWLEREYQPSTIGVRL
jgi:hypothetical protein